LTNARDTLLSDERLQTLLDFVATLNTFLGDLPTEPTALVDFLAQSFVGVPGTALEGVLHVVDPLLSQLDALETAVPNAALPGLLQDLLLALQNTANLVARLDLTAESSLQAVLDQLSAVE